MSSFKGRTARDFFLADKLYDAIEDENMRAVTSLLESKGADATLLLPRRGITPFHYVAGMDSVEFAVDVAKLILQRGGNPNVRSNEGLTPLHISASCGHAEIVKLLLLFGADPDIKDHDDKTALEYAYREKHTEIMHLLLEHLPKPSQVYDDEDPVYTRTLDKIFIETRNYVCEYTFNGTLKQTEPPLSTTLPLLPETNTDEYVRQWCNTQLHTNAKDSDQGDSLGSSLKDPDETTANLLNLNAWPSDNESKSRRASRESGVLTLPDSSVDACEELADLKLGKDTSSDYFTCGSDATNVLERNVFEIPADETQTIYISSDSENGSPQHLHEAQDSSEMSFVTVSGVYLIEDVKAGMVLVEKRLCKDSERFSNMSENGMPIARVSPQSSIEYDNETLKNELTLLGFSPGPITHTTKRVYTNKLRELKRNPPPLPKNALPKNKVYSVELEKALRETNFASVIYAYELLEQKMSAPFDTPDPSKRWREGINKQSFTYLLLDPRITKNLPSREKSMSLEEKWRTFLSSIFYVGKGKQKRPYEHLRDAISLWKEENFETSDKKLKRILDIWGNNCGVVCLQVYHHLIAEEAFTREAAMISALKMENICNKKSGEFYRICATWPERDKRKLGVYLLYKAMNIYFNEGEKQLGPKHLA